MSNKPLHLQQKRYEVRSCAVRSKRAQHGIAVNYWYIHDTLNDSDVLVPTVERSRAFKTRRDAVAVLTRRLERERLSAEPTPAVAEERCLGLEARFRF